MARLVFLFCMVMIISFVSAITILDCKCGESSELAERIIGGKKTKHSKYPWLVLIETKSTLFCGGLIINNKYILTADHCIEENNVNFSIYVNTKHRVRNKGEKYSPVKVIRYQDDKVASRATDILLIKLNRKIEFDEDTYPICLPAQNSVYTHHTLIILGYGIQDNGAAANELREADTVVMTDHYCEKSGIGKHYDKKLHMCAFKNDTDACGGDSGGPLAYNHGTEDEPKYELAGLVSWGIKCAVGVPGVYTRVSHYIPWITKNTQDAGYCSY